MASTVRQHTERYIYIYEATLCRDRQNTRTDKHKHNIALVDTATGKLFISSSRL